jgi:hypothetical protein
VIFGQTIVLKTKQVIFDKTSVFRQNKGFLTKQVFSDITSDF